MNSRAKKIVLLFVAAVLLFGSGRIQQSLNRDRTALNLTIASPLQNAPPLLAFTTVALGGFRGLISNFLWIRANDLQQDDKYFEAAQLADWITDLEPHFSQVWAFQAWNMAYNISVKFKENAPGDYSDRWHWVERGIRLLRDRGLVYNPNDVLLYQQLGWFFQHKLGENIDDGNVYYKEQWAQEMTPFFGPEGTNLVDLLHPQTPEQKTNVMVLKEKYKIDPAFAEKVNEDWGPFDWRLPEPHAIYWASMGLKMAKEHPEKAKQDDLISLRRVLYQSMLQEFHHGKLISNPFTQSAEMVPNLAFIPNLNNLYLTMMKEAAPGDTNNIASAHRNFLRDAVYFLYENDQIKEAAKWFKYLGQRYPNKNLIDGQPDSYPRNLTLDEYAVARVQEDIGETSQDRVTAAVQGLLTHAYLDLAIGQDDRSAGFQLLAQKVYDRYNAKVGDEPRKALPPMNSIKRLVLNHLLDTQQPVIPYAARAVIRTQLGMPAETTNSAAPFVISTNTVPSSALSNTNTPAATNNAVGK